MSATLNIPSIIGDVEVAFAPSLAVLARSTQIQAVTNVSNNEQVV